MQLTETDKQRIEAMVAELESQRGVQAVAAVVGKSGIYPEIPWQAFGLGAAASALVLMLVQPFLQQWPLTSGVLSACVIVLATGLLSALLSLRIPAVARALLPSQRRENRVRRHAESLFLQHELFKTAGRNGVLILVSLFERETSLYLDSGLRASVTREQEESIVGPMRAALRMEGVVSAFEAGVKSLKEILPAKSRECSGNELSDRLIAEPGP